MTIIVALLLGMTLPVTPIQILWINLITAITLGIALAFEPTEENTMRRPPRPRTEPLLSGGLAWHMALVAMRLFRRTRANPRPQYAGGNGDFSFVLRP